MRFGMQRYAFIEGFPPRSGDNFQADDRGDQRRDEEQPPEAGGFLEDQDADEDGPHGADARPHGMSRCRCWPYAAGKTSRPIGRFPG